MCKMESPGKCPFVCVIPTPNHTDDRSIKWGMMASPQPTLQISMSFWSEQGFQFQEIIMYRQNTALILEQYVANNFKHRSASKYALSACFSSFFLSVLDSSLILLKYYVLRPVFTLLPLLHIQQRHLLVIHLLLSPMPNTGLYFPSTLPPNTLSSLYHPPTSFTTHLQKQQASPFLTTKFISLISPPFSQELVAAALRLSGRSPFPG